MRLQHANFRGDYLYVTLHEKGALLNKTVKISLAGLKGEPQFFQAVLSHYWSRHSAMKMSKHAEALIEGEQ